MKYGTVVEGTFISRPNRFIANVIVNGQEKVVHVKNTGRCKELLPCGAAVYLEKSDNLSRKTEYDLIAVKKGELLINMDSQAPNKAAFEWLKSAEFLNELPPESEIVFIKPEYTLGDSRFDFYLEYKNKGTVHKMLIEVKGVTLEENGIVLFPDAPTLRGVKHITELAEYNLGKSYECAVLFVVQMEGVLLFKPNYKTHPQFGEALKKAAAAGVKIMARECNVTADTMSISKSVQVEL